MTIDFICEVLAECFDSPCNYSPMDEQMFKDKFCESHCGKIADKECWKKYFEKLWADRKTEPQTNADQHVQHVECVENNERSRCWNCEHFENMYETPILSDGTYYSYVTCNASECRYEPKTKPQIDAEEVAKDINRRVEMVKKEWKARHIEDEPQREPHECVKTKKKPCSACKYYDWEVDEHIGFREVCYNIGNCEFKKKTEPQTDCAWK